MPEMTIYDPVTKRRLTPFEDTLAQSFANAALVGIMSRSPSELETLTPEAITKQIWRQALDMVEMRRKLTNMNNVFRD
jgi:hypothetical protein